MSTKNGQQQEREHHGHKQEPEWRLQAFSPASYYQHTRGSVFSFLSSLCPELGSLFLESKGESKGKGTVPP